jgi:hypothetical protein
MEIGGITMTDTLTTISEKYDAVQLKLLDLYERLDIGDDDDELIEVLDRYIANNDDSE